MPSRYCIASGEFTDPAIWSDTDGGDGGATVPTNTDDEIYNRSVSITGRTGSSSSNKNIAIGPNAKVSIGHTPNAFFNIAAGKNFRIDGSLSLLSTGQQIFWSNAVLDITKNGRFHIGNAEIRLNRSSSSQPNTAILDNKGVIEGSGEIAFIAALAPAIPHRVGRVLHMRILTSTSPSVPLTVRFRDIIETTHLSILLQAADGAPSIISDFGDTEIHVGTLTFSFWHTEPDRFLQWIQNGPMMVSGNVSREGRPTATTVDWQLGPNASLAFVGSYDQTINMPTDVTGQTWRLQKCDSRGRKSGTLDLSNFVGGLCGNENEPGYAERLIVRGPSVVVTETDIELDELHLFGVTTIPGGVTVRARHVISEPGSSITGGGTLATDRVTEKGGSITCHRKRLNNIITQIKR